MRFAAILFNRVDPLPATIRAVYRPDPNEWNGTVALQLVVQHWEPVEAGSGRARPQYHSLSRGLCVRLRSQQAAVVVVIAPHRNSAPPATKLPLIN